MPRYPWRSPEDQPRWDRPALLAVAAAAAVLYSWNLPNTGFAPYYSTAVRSMSLSWRSLFFATFDPSGTITMDKLGGAFVPQAVSAHIFGFQPWALALPQVVEGVIGVLVLHRVVRRWAGPGAGLLASALLAFTPILASIFDHTMEDGALTLCFVLAVDRYQYAVEHGRLRSLVLAGLWIAVAFQAKMILGWTIVPAVAIGYLLGAPLGLRRRIGHVAAAGAVMFAASVSWMAAIALTPAADRPFIDGTTNNNALTMGLGYDGVGRLGITIHGALAPVGTLTTVQLDVLTKLFGAANASALTKLAGDNYITGWSKLFGEDMATQIGWLYPLAAISLIVGLLWTRDRKRGIEQVGYIMWGVWLVTAALILSGATIPHMAYVSLLAPPLAALSAVGLIKMWAAYREGGSRKWALPITIVLEAVWTTHLWWGHRHFLPWLMAVMIVLAVVATVVLVLTALSERGSGAASRAAAGSDVGRNASSGAAADLDAAVVAHADSDSAAARPSRLAVLGLLTAAAAMFVAPLAWAGSVVVSADAGTAADAAAGPPTTVLPPQIAAFAQQFFYPSSQLTPPQQSIMNYTTQHRDGASFLFATDQWLTAEPYINATGAAVMPMGGFSGDAPSPTLPHIQQLVSSGQLRFFLLTPEPPGLTGASADPGAPPTTLSQIETWVQSSCKAVGTSMPGLYQCGSA